MSILIVVPVHNRKKITELSLYSTNKYKGEGNKLIVYNDHSTEYNNEFLQPYCDEVKKLPARLGVQHLRWYQLREFLKPEYDAYEFIYLTDSDVIHDPDYINQLKTLYSKYMLKGGQKMPVCLYNTIHHAQIQNQVSKNNEILLRVHAPGVSMFYNKDMVKQIVSELNKLQKDPDYGWDYFPSQFLKVPFITSNTSYLDHFGAGGIHNKSTGHRNDYDRDRAENPTSFLTNIREVTIDYLMGLSDKNMEIY